MGKIEIDHTGSGGGITLSSDGTSLLLGGTAIGGSALELYAENPSSPTAPSATGTNAVAIGSSSLASNSNAIAAGFSAAAQGADSVAIGRGATSSNFSGATALGLSASAYGTNSVALGNSRAGGTNCFAAAIDTNSTSYGATINYSIAIGRNAKASNADAFAVGRQNQATASNSVSMGNGSIASGPFGIAMGYQTQATAANTVAIGAASTYTEKANATAQGAVALGGAYANGTDSVAIGASAKSTQIGKISFSNAKFSAVGDSQGGQFILRAATTDATATVLTTNNATAASTNQIVAASDTCITFDGTITAMQNGAQAYASWKIEGLLVNDGGTTTLANSATTVIQNLSSWGMALSADNTNNALAITVTGEAAHNIRWVANIRTTEVTYA